VRNIKITIEYDGSGYVGWQRQPSGPTIQETIESSLTTITGERIKLLGSGRTDSGVHALGQVAHLDVRTNVPAETLPALFPYGLYTIPEVSFVGRTEEQLTAARVPYEVGIANYREIARGGIIGDTIGRLKLIFHRETGLLLGVHIIGEGATELVHIGQAVIAFGGTIRYFVDHVFNYPTLAECYKVAALAGFNKLGAQGTPRF